MRRTLLTVLLATAACEPSSLTEVVVTVRADRMVAARATETSLVLTRDPAGAATVLHGDERTRRKAEFPYSIGLSPSEGREDGRYQVEVSAWEGEQRIATARLNANYVAGQTRFVELWLEDRCIDVVCGEQETCSGGACRDATVDAKSFSRDRQSAPRSAELTGPVDVEVPAGKPGTDTQGDGAPPPAGSDRTGAPLPSPDASTPAGPGPDASTPASQPADSPDAAAPTVVPDAGTPMTPVGTPSPVTPGPAPVTPTPATPATPDAGTSQPSDAGSMPTVPSFVCAPRGTWIARREELEGGGCGSNIPEYHPVFYGKLSDPMANEDGCHLTHTLSADGCVMTYQHDCPVTTPTETFIERETGRIEMTSATTMTGTGTVVLLELVTYADKGCKSMVVHSARPQ